MRVVVFYGDPRRVEKQVLDWLEPNGYDKEIHHIKQSESFVNSLGHVGTNVTISIWYDELATK